MKVITSPVPEFPGTITLITPLNLEQAYYISVALETAEKKGESRAQNMYANNRAVLEALIHCSEVWCIQGQPEKPEMESFASTPFVPAQRLLAWAFRELTNIYLGEQTIPNG